MAKTKDQTENKTEAPKPQKRYRVTFSHLRDANGNDHFRGEVLTYEEIGNAELHLSRGAIEEIEDVSEPVEEATQPKTE